MIPSRIVPLISDTESKPTAPMREAIARAEVGDEQRGEDPTVNTLQQRVADLLGKEAALWFPGGTMCNFVAIKVHTKPGDAIVADGMAHIIRAESAGVAFSSGVLIESIATERGVFTAAQLREAVARLRTAPTPYGPPVRLVCVEQTHNFGGGAVWSAEELRAVADASGDLGIAVHMDGARLLNACAATGVTATAFAAMADSVGSTLRRVSARRSEPCWPGRRSSSLRRAGTSTCLLGPCVRLASPRPGVCTRSITMSIGCRRTMRGLGASLRGLADPGIVVRTPRPKRTWSSSRLSTLGCRTPSFSNRC